MREEIKARLTPEAQGYNDVYWCDVANLAALIAPGGVCSACHLSGISPERYDHKFLAHVYDGHEANEMVVVAEVVKGVDDAEAEIGILRKAISQFGQQVHQAYHGAHPLDLCDVYHLECPRGLCRSIQRLLDPSRARGKP